MAYFPMFVNLDKKRVLIAGGGRVALRKLRKLAPYGVKPVVVAPKILEEIVAFPEVEMYQRCFSEDDLKPRPVLVIAATNDMQVNHQISALCHEQNIPVNVADDPKECSFLFPALVQRGDFSAGISTGGASPAASIYYKERLQEILPEKLDDILSWLELKRKEMKEQIPEQAKRAGTFRRLFDACLEKGAPLTEKETLQYIEKLSVGSVALVGAGCGKADLITVRGLRLLQQCQAVVYDDLIDPALLDAAPESALRIYMGKRSGSHSASQDEINQKLIELARSGLKVVRLKGGDPYLFGRGGEEMLALKEAVISCQEVPGIPSAIGIAAEAGIPVTHRGASRGLHIVTAHTSDTEDHLPEDFEHLAKLSGTLVFLMGLQQLPKIAERLIAAGKRMDTPAAVLSGGNSVHPAKVRAPLHQIAQAAKMENVMAPAIILVGDVAALDLTADQNLLNGVKVGIIGTEAVAKKQQKMLAELGAESKWVIRSQVKELPMKLDIEALLNKSYWLVFTSANGVRIFFSQMKRKEISPEILKNMSNLKFAVIGSATGTALQEYGITANVCPETFTSEGLAEILAAEALPEEEIVLLRSIMGSWLLPDFLKKKGFIVHDMAIYELENVYADRGVFADLDYLTFSSAGGVESFFGEYHKMDESVKSVCIGSVTAKAMSRYTENFLVANEISAAGVVQTILNDKMKEVRI